MNESIKQHYLADSPPTVVRLEVKSHFDNLKDQNLRKYAHFMSRAAFEGTRVTLRQVSPESEPIYDLILALYHVSNGDWNSLAQKTQVSAEDLRFFLEYAGQFLGNCGNYKGFGDSKFIPRLSASAFEALASVTAETKAAFQKANTTGGGIYETSEQSKMHLGYPKGGHMTTYYPDSPTISQEEITAIGDLMEKKGLALENTRIRKTSSGDFELLIASGVSSPPVKDRDLGEGDTFELDGDLKGKTVRLVFGDHDEEMTKIAHSIKQARLAAANENQKKMLDSYALSFGAGSIEAFKESQRIWVKDQKPVLETNLGFVETYRDPHGVRGEWEGFVALVNLERTRAFGTLVASAESMIPKLPWGTDFEKDKFLSPDFTSLEVLSFASSGLPAGINLPNYDDIRQNLGFKNVSLGNVLSAKAPNEAIPFIAESDQEVFRIPGSALRSRSESTNCWVMELNPPISPVTNKPYRPGTSLDRHGARSLVPLLPHTRSAVLSVAMVLGCDFGILKIFGFGDGKEDLAGEAGDVLFAAYLSMARAPVWLPRVLGSENPEMGSHALRYSILRTFLNAGDDFKLHVYKSTADVEAGKGLYDDITSVDSWWGTTVREVVLKNKVPRKVFVQANTILEGDQVSLKEYEPTLEGLIQSFAERNV
ncbi:hypothetical protein PDIDSM_3916 [Penicillium digitatum]|nr:hypothetical protein PDIDSM_3916 [Penicillium digitatum]